MRIMYGVVKDVNDPAKCGRIKVHIDGYNKEFDVDDLEWVERHAVNSESALDLPNVNDNVKVYELDSGVLEYSLIDFTDKALIDELGAEYVNSMIAYCRNLDQYDSSGQLAVFWSPKLGHVIRIKESFVNIKNEGDILIFNGSKYIHVVNDTISLGSKDKSAEPAVLGDKNFDALNMLNDTDKAQWNATSSALAELATAASSAPFTMHLAPIFAKLGLQLGTKMATAYPAQKQANEKTKSKIVNLD